MSARSQDIGIKSVARLPPRGPIRPPAPQRSQPAYEGSIDDHPAVVAYRQRSRFNLAIAVGGLILLGWIHDNCHHLQSARRELPLPTEEQMAGTAQRCRDGNPLSCLALQGMIERYVKVAARGGLQ
jgi:hypothetical protein